MKSRHFLVKQTTPPHNKETRVRHKIAIDDIATTGGCVLAWAPREIATLQSFDRQHLVSLQVMACQKASTEKLPRIRSTRKNMPLVHARMRGRLACGNYERQAATKRDRRLWEAILVLLILQNPVASSLMRLTSTWCPGKDQNLHRIHRTTPPFSGPCLRISPPAYKNNPTCNEPRSRRTDSLSKAVSFSAISIIIKHVE